MNWLRWNEIGKQLLRFCDRISNTIQKQLKIHPRARLLNNPHNQFFLPFSFKFSLSAILPLISHSHSVKRFQGFPTIKKIDTICAMSLDFFPRSVTAPLTQLNTAHSSSWKKNASRTPKRKKKGSPPVVMKWKPGFCYPPLSQQREKQQLKKPGRTGSSLKYSKKREGLPCQMMSESNRFGAWLFNENEETWADVNKSTLPRWYRIKRSYLRHLVAWGGGL